jgi:hypothetical protein
MSMVIDPYRFGTPAPFSPTDLSDLRAWYDASQLAGLSDNDVMTGWVDESSNALDLTKVGTGSILYKTNIKNGLPAVRFPGGTNHMQRASTSLSPTTGLWSAFAVFMRTGTTGILNVVDADHANAGVTARQAQAIRCNALTLESVGFNVAGSAVTDAAGTALSASTFLCASAVRTTGAVESWVNGSSNGSTSIAGTPNLGAIAQLGIGGSARNLGLTGDMGEAIIYSRDLNSTERGQVEAYLAAKWAI